MSTSTIARVDRTVMGVKTSVTVVGESSAVIAHRCLDSLSQLEHLWSRFINTSDIMRLNNANGEPVWVNDKTIQLVAYMQAAFTETNGAFNPMLLPVQLQTGDTRSLVDEGSTELPVGSRANSHIEDVQILDDGRIQLLNGSTLDAGGIAKGFAADLVTGEAVAMGAIGACVNIGGDMAIHTGSHEAWPVDVMSPIHSTEVLDTVLISHGGIATSAINARHRDGSKVENHIFTMAGASQSQTIGATVLASHAAWAEAWTKFAIVQPAEEVLDVISQKDLAALLVLRDGSTLTTDSWKELSR